MSDLLPETLRALRSEIIRARKQYPTNARNHEVLREFVFRLSRSLNNSTASVQVYAEAICVATMALRIAEEGDGNSKYQAYKQSPGPLFRDIPASQTDLEELIRKAKPKTNDDPCPKCGTELECASGGGVKCPNCSYWFCY
jgi:hypothetical protein